MYRLAVTDLRDTLPRAQREHLGRRPGKPTSITLHYNGKDAPVAPARQQMPGLLKQLTGDANWQMKPGWGGTTHGADGIQYHFAIDAIGAVIQLRDLDEGLYHAGHAKANLWSLAIHVPIGGDQDATPAQWASFGRLCDALIADYGMAGRRVVVGHQEWVPRDCPGQRLMNRLRIWRALKPAPASKPYQVASGTPIYTDRRSDSPVALGGTAYLDAGRLIDVDDVTAGWAHLANELGFVPLACLVAL